MSSLKVLNNSLIRLPERAVRFKVKYKVADSSVIYLFKTKTKNKKRLHLGYFVTQQWVLTAYSLLDCAEKKGCLINKIQVVGRRESSLTFNFNVFIFFISYTKMF